ncbi:MAG: STAS domain-containing protein [Fibrobacterota bacterium]
MNAEQSVEIFKYSDAAAANNGAEIVKVIDNADREGKYGFLVDMDRIDFIYSIGIRAVISGYKAAEDRDLNFGLFNVSEGVRKALALVNLSTKIKVYESVDHFMDEIEI